MLIIMKTIKPKRQISFIVLYFLLAVLFNISCREKEVNYQLETFQVTQSGWGYKIYRQNRSFIVQYNIPAIPDKLNFKSEKDAERTGNLMIEKLRAKKIPSVLMSELDSMNIQYE